MTFGNRATKPWRRSTGCGLVVAAFLVATTFVSGTGIADAASTCGGSLGQAQGFIEFSIGNGSRQNSDVEGRAAYGGNLTAQSFAFGQGLANDATRKDLIVGGNITATNGVNVQHGAATYGGTIAGTVTAFGGISHNSPPFSFSTEAGNLNNESGAIAGLVANGTAVTSGSGFVVLTLTGTDLTQNVFSLTAAQLAAVNEVDIKVPLTGGVAATTLINVTGDYTVAGLHPLNAIKLWNGSAFEQASNGGSAGFQSVRTHLLWNFSSAVNLTIATNQAFQGSVLAPLAAVTIGQGQTNGTVIGATISGPGQTNNARLDPAACLPVQNTPQTPEVPYAVLLPIAFGVVGALSLGLSRRRAALSELPVK